MALYNLRSADGDWRITKFDGDLNVESSYLVSTDACECPAGHRPSCRHRQMLPRMLAAQAEDSPMFYDFDRDTWLAPEQTFDESEIAELPDGVEKDNHEIVTDAIVSEALPEGVYGVTPIISSGGLEQAKADNAKASANLRQSATHPQGSIRRRL